MGVRLFNHRTTFDDVCGLNFFPHIMLTRTLPCPDLNKKIKEIPIPDDMSELALKPFRKSN
jgi:hypothetical protein